MKIALVALGFFVLPLTAHAAQAVDLIVNGSFEDGNYSPIIDTSWVEVYPGEDQLTGWTVGGAHVDWHQNSYEIQSAFTGERMIDLNANGFGLSDTGTISQSFATEVGRRYSLSFYLSGPSLSLPSPRQVRVDIGGTQRVFSEAASYNLNLVWGKKVHEFEATAPVTTLTFSSVDGSGYWGPFIDDVAVIPIIPVPEPETTTLGVLGLLVACVHRATRCRDAETN